MQSAQLWLFKSDAAGNVALFMHGPADRIIIFCGFLQHPANKRSLLWCFVSLSPGIPAQKTRQYCDVNCPKKRSMGCATDTKNREHSSTRLFANSKAILSGCLPHKYGLERASSSAPTSRFNRQLSSVHMGDHQYKYKTTLTSIGRNNYDRSK